MVINLYQNIFCHALSLLIFWWGRIILKETEIKGMFVNRLVFKLMILLKLFFKGGTEGKASARSTTRIRWKSGKFGATWYFKHSWFNSLVLSQLEIIIQLFDLTFPLLSPSDSLIEAYILRKILSTHHRS